MLLHRRPAERRAPWGLGCSSHRPPDPEPLWEGGERRGHLGSRWGPRRCAPSLHPLRIYPLTCAQAARDPAAFCLSKYSAWRLQEGGRRGLGGPGSSSIRGAHSFSGQILGRCPGRLLAEGSHPVLFGEVPYTNTSSPTRIRFPFLSTLLSFLFSM